MGRRAAGLRGGAPAGVAGAKSVLGHARVARAGATLLRGRSASEEEEGRAAKAGHTRAGWLQGQLAQIAAAGSGHWMGARAAVHHTEKRVARARAGDSGAALIHNVAGVTGWRPP